jgi:lysozyme
MKTSAKGIELIKKFEGFKGDAYCCPAGVLTIGYGFTTDVKLGDKITKEEADKRLISELGYFERVIEKHVKVVLSQNQFDALVSFVFNVGEGAFKKSTLLKNLNNGLYNTVPAQLLRWNKAGKNVLAGLTRRRQAEGMLFSETIIEPPMPQAVDSPDKSMAASRTMQNATLMGGVGATLAIAPAIEPAGKIVKLAQEHTQGFLLVLGLIVLAAAAYAIYLRLDARKKGL